MKIFEAGSFAAEHDKLSKKKKQKYYQSIDQEIVDFFKAHPDFDSIWSSQTHTYEASGVRVMKIRLPNRTQKQGKSGGYRLILLANSNDQSIALLYIYPKIGPDGKSSIEKSEENDLVKAYVREKKAGTLHESVRFNLT